MNGTLSMMLKKITLAACSVALVGVLTACGDDVTSNGPATQDGAGSTTGEASPGNGAGEQTQSARLEVTDPWVKASDEGMTAAFATLTNIGDTELVVTAARTEAAGRAELHETVENADGSMAMQAREGGFVIPAGGHLMLAPGGEHIMLMDLAKPLEPGEAVAIDLTLADGSTLTFEATVKAFDGADEKYQHGAEH